MPLLQVTVEVRKVRPNSNDKFCSGMVWHSTLASSSGMVVWCLSVRGEGQPSAFDV